jgi:hypothetical protein
LHRNIHHYRELFILMNTPNYGAERNTMPTVTDQKETDAAASLPADVPAAGMIGRWGQAR